MNRRMIQCLALAVEPGILLPWKGLLLLAAVLPISLALSHDPCTTSNLTPGGVGSRGNITSTNYPHPLPSKSPSDHNCRMVITACAACNIQITYDEFLAPPCHTEEIPIGSCVPQCDHLMLFENDYPEDTTQYVFGDSTLSTYTTLSNRLTLVICHTISHDDAMRRFRLGYEIQEKRRVIRGEVGEVGYFTSPNFPHGYSLHDEVFTFLLENKDPTGLVRLGFDDWNISPNSRLTVYFHNATHPDGYLTRKGRGERPFVLSSGPSLFIKFETGQDQYAIPYIGFKATYEFVSEPYWPDKPYTVHDEYFYSRFGGEFSFNTQRCWPGDRVDCIWVVTKYNDHNHDQVALNIEAFYIVPGLDFLEIRSGNSSDGLLLGEYEHSNLTGTQFVSRHGFYLRLRATCSNTRRFHAVFTSFTNATNEGCTYYYHFQCGNTRCIAKSLVCDGIDHCSDGTDEMGCTTPNPSTRKECITTYACRSGIGWYCLTDRCNGHNDCKDGTDELDCWNTVTPFTERPYMASYYKLGTYIPVGLVIVLLAVIACIVISCCARRKRNLMRRRAQAGQTGRGLPSISASLPGRGRRMRSSSETHLNINVEIQHYPDSPPPYEEAISQSQSAYSGIHNMAFTMSDSSDQMPPPPPYSPHDENPYPPPMPPPRSLFMPGPTGGGVIIGMPPPGGQYSSPQEVVRPQIPLVGAADITGSVDLAQVHMRAGGGNGATSNRRNRDANCRRSRGQSRQSVTTGNTQSSQGGRDSIEIAQQGARRDNTRLNQQGSETLSSGRDNPTVSQFRGLADSKPDQVPPPPPRRPSSGTSSPIQTFVQNLISRAARQSTPSSHQQPAGPQSVLRSSGRARRAAPPAPPQSLPLQPQCVSSSSNINTSSDNNIHHGVSQTGENNLDGNNSLSLTEGEQQRRGTSIAKDDNQSVPPETVQQTSPSSEQVKPDPDESVNKLIHSPVDQQENNATEDNSNSGDKHDNNDDTKTTTTTSSDRRRPSASIEVDESENCDIFCNINAVQETTPDREPTTSVAERRPREADSANRAITLEGADDSMTFV